MKINRFLAKQFANPTGWFGQHVTARMLNRANGQSNAAVIDALSIERNDRFLEIGFGGADLLFNVATAGKCAEVWGVEKSQAMLDRAKARVNRSTTADNVSLLLGGIEQLPAENGYFDKVCSVNTIYFWQSLEHGASEIARITAVNGKVVLGFGSGEKLEQSGYTEKGFRFYSIEKVHRAMSDANLELVKTHKLERKNKDPFFVPVFRKNA